MRDGVSRQDGNTELRRSFTKDVLPLIGKKPLRTLTEKDLLNVLRSVKARGLNRTVVIRSKDIGQMLRWAETQAMAHADGRRQPSRPGRRQQAARPRLRGTARSPALS